ncbi:O-antigen ligase family protein [Alkalibacterium pelagium]|uniref:O-antigen ligase n=1 Tax=Alkalibacterium pelagium TaxID=426702 RepID=A0A1H7NM81_9LACT|nr:O-antigen ligase family protein [Alkalibacterium pelagium]GEN51434.1 O-antigen polymerase [Alkalibacterium pelagium]SEL24622.1 O-antigen ligase [Alkalibacterium pelagium]
MEIKIDKKNILSVIFALFVFISINLPSVKILYSSEIVNIVALSGLMTVGLIRWIISNEPMFQIDERQLKVIFNFILLWQIMFAVTWLIRPLNFDTIDLLQYISVGLFTLSIFIFLRREDLKYIIFFQVSWGTGIGFLEWTTGIPKSRALGQTYLTTGVAIAATIVVVIGLLFSKEVSKYLKAVLVPVVLVLYAGVTSLSGRAPILLSLVVPVVVYLISIIFEKDIRKKFSALLLFITILTVGLIMLYNVLPTSTVNRIMRAFLTIQEEPRYELYQSAANVVLENPLGIGLRGYQSFDFGYPHNIFLEITMSGGLMALIPFISVVIYLLRTAINVTREKSLNLVWLNLSFYFLLTWNISFELSNSYMVFIPLALLIKSESLRQLIPDNNKAYPYDSYRRMLSNNNYLESGL